MNRFMSFISACILMLLPISGNTENLLNYIEYKIPKSDLIAFSKNGVRVKFCDTCEIRDIKLTSNVELFDQNTPITTKRATELYIQNPYTFVSIYINKVENQADRIRFGGFDELQPNLIIKE